MVQGMVDPSATPTCQAPRVQAKAYPEVLLVAGFLHWHLLSQRLHVPKTKNLISHKKKTFRAKVYYNYKPLNPEALNPIW